MIKKSIFFLNAIVLLSMYSIHGGKQRASRCCATVFSADLNHLRSSGDFTPRGSSFSHSEDPESQGLTAIRLVPRSFPDPGVQGPSSQLDRFGKDRRLIFSRIESTEREVNRASDHFVNQWHTAQVQIHSFNHTIDHLAARVALLEAQAERKMPSPLPLPASVPLLPSSIDRGEVSNFFCNISLSPSPLSEERSD